MLSYIQEYCYILYLKLIKILVYYYFEEHIISLDILDMFLEILYQEILGNQQYLVL